MSTTSVPRKTVVALQRERDNIMELPNLAPAKARIQAEKQEKLLKDILLAGLAEQIVDKILTDEFFQSIPDAVDEVVVTPAMWGTHDIDITAFVEAIKARMVVVGGTGPSPQRSGRFCLYSFTPRIPESAGRSSAGSGLGSKPGRGPCGSGLY